MADAGTSLHDGDQIKTMFAEELDRHAGTLMALNISAWSIRNPLPSIVFSIILLVLRLGQLHQARGDAAAERRHPGDLGRGLAIRRRRPSELESQVTKTIEDGVSGVEGVRHISSSITDGLSRDHDPVRARDQHRPRAERRQGRRHPRAAPTCRRTSTSR